MLTGKPASSGPHFSCQSASISCGMQAMKSPNSFFLIDANSICGGLHQGARKNKSRPDIRRLISRETSLRNLFVPRIERLLAQGTVASPARLPDSNVFESLLMLVPIITAILSAACCRPTCAKETRGAFVGLPRRYLSSWSCLPCLSWPPSRSRSRSERWSCSTRPRFPSQ